ncbi:MAG: hypothetical protein EXQ56_12300 [Acidobacteria bacterium]|nr:hypothetical protein [Acidobacteriota bacterium]
MRSTAGNTPSHITQASGNIFTALGFPPEVALALKFKAKNLASILAEVKRKKYTQSALVQKLDKHQPAISN